MKRILLLALISVFSFTHFTYAQVTKTENADKGNISKNAKELTLFEDDILSDPSKITTSDESNNGYEMPTGQTTCTTYDITGNYQCSAGDVTFSRCFPYYGYQGNPHGYSYSRDTRFTFPKLAESVTVRVQENRYYLTGARIFAYDKNGVYIGQTETTAGPHGWVILTYTAPTGKKIKSVVVQSRRGASGTFYMDYMTVCYPYNDPPVAIAQNVSVNADDNCQAVVDASMVDNGSYDPNGDEITLSISPAGPYPIGTTSVTLTVSDGEKSSTATANITVTQATTCVTHDITGYSQCSAGNMTFSPCFPYQGYQGVPHGYSRQSSLTTFNIQGSATSVTIRVQEWSAMRNGARMVAYDQNNNAVAEVSTRTGTRGWNIISLSVPCGTKIDHFTIQPLFSGGVFYLDYLAVCYLPNEAPVAIAQDVSVNAGANCQAAVNASLVDDGSYDLDGDDLTMSLSPVGPYPTGTTAVTLTVSDGQVTSIATANITVSDISPPEFTVSTIFADNDPGVCEAYIELPDPVVTENCGVAELVNDAPLTFPVGRTIVNWTATDVHGNSTVMTQDVIVSDMEPPVIEDLPDLTQDNDPGVCGAYVELIYPVVTDNCGDVELVNDAPPTFMVGTTTVTWMATDIHGNSSVMTQDVVVTDAENPVIQVLSAITQNNDEGYCSAEIVLTAPVVTDNCGVASIENDAPAIFPVGTTTVTWTSTDIHGNSSVMTQNVIVTDTEDPVIEALSAVLSDNDEGYCSAKIVLTAPVVTDNCGVASIENDAPYIFPVGTTTVTWTASDIHGNSAEMMQDVVVTDTEDPVIEALSAVLSDNDEGFCSAEIVLTAPIVTDNCGVASIENDAPAIFPVGTTTVTWTATDIHGNSSVMTQNVIVTDTEDPVIEALSAVLSDNDEGYCSAEIVLTAPIVTDNCGVASIESDAPSIFPVGITTVTWTATDIHGNSSVMTQDVIVTDTEAPVLEGLSAMTQDNDPGVCGAVVAIPAPVVTDNCGVASIGNDAPTIFPIGITTVTWTATDIHGNSVVMTQEVIVNDTETPILIVTTDVRTLWPVNHKYSTVSLSELLISATDNCSLDINGVFIMSVSSDEPEDAKGGGDGNTKKDILIADDCLSVDLRAERNGNGNGRVYTITLAVSDETGNVSTAECYVQVPHSKKGTAINDGADAGYTIFSKCSNKNGFTFGEIDNPDYEDISLKTYPNPFAHTTEIEFYLPNESHVNLKIYDITGKLVHILIDRNFSTGLVRVTWDGSDNHGNKLNNGIYFAILQTRNGLARNSMIISR